MNRKPEHQALEFWIGTWEIEAQSPPNPLFPEGEYRAAMTAEWHRTGLHMFCEIDWTGALGPYASTLMHGYDVGTGEYVVFQIDGFGGNKVYRGERQGNAWHYTREMEVDGKPAIFRWIVTNRSPGVITWTSELSVQAGPWVLLGEARATRK